MILLKRQDLNSNNCNVWNGGGVAIVQNNDGLPYIFNVQNKQNNRLYLNIGKFWILIDTPEKAGVGGILKAKVDPPEQSWQMSIMMVG